MPGEASFTIGFHKMHTFCTLGSRKQATARKGWRPCILHANMRTRITATVTAVAAATQPSDGVILPLLCQH